VRFYSSTSIFYKEADFDINDVHLNEGEKLVWVTKADLGKEPIAFDFLDDVIAEFFTHRAWE
jgi:hypothetical protein